VHLVGFIIRRQIIDILNKTLRTVPEYKKAESLQNKQPTDSQ
jgi:hypothetical protein